uniref:Putative TBP-associated factor 4 isoform 1 n=1 Tax=Davidia involucrata TaxID=16924 RepID=A0A5B7ABZ1_DAVIN
MDPSIMKFLEEDEDETMHSGADLEAFTAALNRDIQGDTSTSQPTDSDSAALSQGSNHTSSQLFSQWQTSSQDESANYQNQQDLKGSQQQEQHSSEMELKQHISGSESQQQQMDTLQGLDCIPLQQKQSQDDGQQRQSEQNTLHFPQTMGMQNSEKNPVHIQEPDRTHNPDSESQYPKLQKTSNQLPMAPEQAINPMNRGKQVPFALLLPVIQPQLDKDRAMQLQTIYLKLKQNEISKDGFVRHMRSIVGDQMLKMAVYKLQAQAARNSQTGPNQFSLQSQASAQQQHLKMPSASAKQFTDPQSFAQLHHKGVGSPADPSHIPPSATQVKTDSSNVTMDNNAQKSGEVEHQSDSQGMHVSQMSSSSLSTVNQEREHPTIPIQGLSKQQQQHLHFSQSSFPMYGTTGGNYHPFSGTNVNTSGTSLKQQPHDSQMRQLPVHQSVGATQLGMGTQAMNVMSVPKFERPQNSFSDPKRVQGGALSHLTNNSTLQHNSVHWQSSTSKEQVNGAPSSMTYVKQELVDQSSEQQPKSQLSTPQGLSSFSSVQVEQGNTIPGTSKDEIFEMQSSRMGFSTSTSMVPSNPVSSSMMTQLDPLSSRMPSATSTVGPGSSAKTPPKKPSIGQKKPLEVVGSSPPLSSKKQKVSGAFLDQSIEQLNDVTAVSGVNIREEEEQLFSGPKEDSQVSEVSRRVVQEEEERLILQKLPLQKKLAEIMAKCGVKSISNDVEQCLSLCVEERMRGLISNLIRLSKQRVDIEKPRHQTLITSDVRQQIVIMNRKAWEEREKKQAEAEKLQKLNEPVGTGVDGDKEKDEGRVKSLKANKEEDDKMRTTAANVAARAAVGGDDMLSKWQLMAEQARQKREGGIDAASGSQLGNDASCKPLSTSGRNAKDNQEAEKRGHSAAIATSGRIFGRNQVALPQTRVAHSISIKDVISVFEREPQMSKSTLIYRLYDKMRANAVAE